VKRTVLVVDDETEVRESLEDVLRDEGYTVLGAANGQEALALLPRLERPCAILLDIIMPVMSGREFYQALRADPRFADVPVLVSTSDPSRCPNGVPSVTKPVSVARLLSLLSALFPPAGPRGGPGEGELPVGPAIASADDESGARGRPAAPSAAPTPRSPGPTAACPAPPA
jgi:CheY-like chemotaxis protein